MANVEQGGTKEVVLISATGLITGRKTVTTAGTRVPLVSVSTPCSAVCITALESNTGTIVVGGVTVVALLATREGTPIYATGSFIVEVDDLADIYIDSTVNGEGVSFTAEL